jgi:hypothetical protein
MMLALTTALWTGGCNSSPAPTGTDSGPVGTDTGPVGTDTGPPELDAGPAPVDAGPGDVDGGPVGAGACTNTADMAVLGSIDVGMVVGDCAMMTLGMEPATSNCIMMSGLSAGCTACFSATVSCTVANCLSQCIGGDSPACLDCRATNCDPAFAACSGLTP